MSWGETVRKMVCVCVCVRVWPTWESQEWLRGSFKEVVVHDNLRSVAGVVALVEEKD